eukprot:gene11875-14525_t
MIADHQGNNFKKEDNEYTAFLVYTFLPALPDPFPPFVYLDTNKFSIGRDSKNNLTIDSTEKSHNLSRRHSVISIEDNSEKNDLDNNNNDLILLPQENLKYKYFIEDLGTVNGTFVNEKIVESKYRLEHNDRIRFGSLSSNVRYTFKIVEMLSNENTEIFNSLRIDYMTNNNMAHVIRNNELSRLFTPLYEIQTNLMVKLKNGDDTTKEEEEEDLGTNNSKKHELEMTTTPDGNVLKKKKLVKLGDNEENSPSPGLVNIINNKITTKQHNSTYHKVERLNQNDDQSEYYDIDFEYTEETDEILEPYTEIQFKYMDPNDQKYCGWVRGEVKSFDEKSNQYIINYIDENGDRTTYSVDKKRVRRPWVKKLIYKTMSTGHVITVQVYPEYPELFYDALIMEKKRNTKHPKILYMVRFLDFQLKFKDSYVNPNICRRKEGIPPYKPVSER